MTYVLRPRDGALRQPAQRGRGGRPGRRGRDRQPGLRRRDAPHHQGRGRPHQRHQVQDVRLRRRRGHLQHGHRDGQGQDPAGGARGLQQGGGRGARRAAARQDALLQPGRRRAAHRHRRLPGAHGGAALRRHAGGAGACATPRRTAWNAAGKQSAAACTLALPAGGLQESTPKSRRPHRAERRRRQLRRRPAAARAGPSRERRQPAHLAGRHMRSCCSPDALQRARACAHRLGLPFEEHRRRGALPPTRRRAVRAGLPGRRDAEPVRRLQPFPPGRPGGAGRRAGCAARWPPATTRASCGATASRSWRGQARAQRSVVHALARCRRRRSPTWSSLWAI